MNHSWKRLTALTEGKDFVIRSIRIPGEDLEIRGNFELPPLARLSQEDQLFAAAFIKTHGSIKQMEQIFGISYPTVKNRLNAIGSKMDFIDVEVNFKPPVAEILDRLERGEISPGEALKEMK